MSSEGLAPHCPLQWCGVVGDEDVLVGLFDSSNPRTVAKGTGTGIERGRLCVSFLEPVSRVRIHAPKGGWDLSRRVAVLADVENVGQTKISVCGQINNQGPNERFQEGWVVSALHLSPGESGTLTIFLPKPGTQKDNFPGMVGRPGGSLFDWNALWEPKANFLEIHDLDGISVGGAVQIHAIRAFGLFDVLHPPGNDFFPFVDAFGQYRHSHWPGKVSSSRDLAEARDRETVDLASNLPLADRSRYGGWGAGPQLRATGHFRTEKVEGKWWLVDPDGYLFWSTGMTGVGIGGSKTSLEGRRHYFEAAPPDIVDEKAMVDFGTANLRAKYGRDWEREATATTRARLQSWGMNTCACWSSVDIFKGADLPYTVYLHLAGKKDSIRNDSARFRELARRQFTHCTASTRGDPWCIGYFVENELDFSVIEDPDAYYGIVKEELQRAAPGKLYLGSRLKQRTPAVVAAAAKHCDVVSMNVYTFSPAFLQLHGDIDKPIMIGEFHFGALDRGMLHGGLRMVGNQKQRADAYRHYVMQAILHPRIVGAHWFQYREQPVTGRGKDGENYQIGFVDICDTPSAEMVAAARGLHGFLYNARASAACGPERGG